MSKSFFETKKWKQFMNMVYGIGAAVVIAGALFKIMHWKGADMMLVVGMGTECIIFVISAFEPVHMDPDWSLVYPELAGADPVTGKDKKSNLTVKQQLDQMLEEAKVGPELISSLGTGLKSLSQNVNEMSSISSASLATNEYAANAQKAAKNLEDISRSTVVASETMNSFTGGLSNVLNNITASESASMGFRDGLGQLNSQVGELNQQCGVMNSAIQSFNGGLNSIAGNIQASGNETANFNSELSQLNRNLGNLNTIYGNMLSAMGGSR